MKPTLAIGDDSIYPKCFKFFELFIVLEIRTWLSPDADVKLAAKREKLAGKFVIINRIQALASGGIK